MKKWIRVMSSLEGTGIWETENPAPIDPESLPMSAALKKRLADWVATPAEDRHYGKPTWKPYVDEGRAIAKKLKSELPSHKITYEDLSISDAGPEAKAFYADPTRKPYKGRDSWNAPSPSEIEITLEPKLGRGRPRKVIVEPKRKPGRPRKSEQQVAL
jgi:hypothetical protein